MKRSPGRCFFMAFPSQWSLRTNAYCEGSLANGDVGRACDLLRQFRWSPIQRGLACGEVAFEAAGIAMLHIGGRRSPGLRFQKSPAGNASLDLCIFQSSLAVSSGRSLKQTQMSLPGAHAK